MCVVRAINNILLYRNFDKFNIVISTYEISDSRYTSYCRS